jgi:hypothetical protein
MVDIMAGHSFDDGPEVHRAPFGMSGKPVAISFRDGAEVMKIPFARGLKEIERRYQIVSNVTLYPDVLIKRLDDRMRLTHWSSERLAETEGEDHFAVGKVRDDLANAPLCRSWPLIHLFGRERSDDAAKLL